MDRDERKMKEMTAYRYTMKRKHGVMQILDHRRILFISDLPAACDELNVLMDEISVLRTRLEDAGEVIRPFADAWNGWREAIEGDPDGGIIPEELEVDSSHFLAAAEWFGKRVPPKFEEISAYMESKGWLPIPSGGFATWDGDYEAVVWCSFEGAAEAWRYRGTTQELLPRVTNTICCLDCRLPYANFGLDTTLPNEQWLMIHPEGEGGLLCANCIVKRAGSMTDAIAVRMVLDIDETALVSFRDPTQKEVEYGLSLVELAEKHLGTDSEPDTAVSPKARHQIDALLALLESIRNASPDVEEFKLWKEAEKMGYLK